MNAITSDLKAVKKKGGLITAKERQRLLLPALLFTLYLFAFLLTEFTVNEKCAAVLGKESVTAVYALGIICTSAGYGGFYLSRTLIKSEGKRRLIIAAFAFAYLIAAPCFMFASGALLFVISAFSALFLFGYIGGFTHYAASLFLFGEKHSGKVIGGAVALAVLLQFIVQNLLVTDIALIVSLFLSVGGICYLAAKPVGDWLFENPLNHAEKPLVTAKILILPICIVAVMSMCHGLGDGVITQLHAAGAINLASYSRLWYAASAFGAGVISDMFERRLLPLCTLCMLVLFSTMALFIGQENAAANNLYVVAVYIFSGFYVMYLTVTFSDSAPLSAKPDLWAGMGRIVRGIFIGLTAAISNPLFESIGQQGLVIAGICLSLLVLVLFVAGGALNIIPEKKTENSRDRLPGFIASYSLTPREGEVLAQLLVGKHTNADIAKELAISVRVLQRYIASIYEKARVQSRAGLIKLYYEN
ncbi:MAG: helix-turn-helix transcriptional regulator [Eubacteriaceae bacterium]|nr:helix-turn-helix transcriptional regulator [Eubacteriaceae bacterium]